MGEEVDGPQLGVSSSTTPIHDSKKVEDGNQKNNKSVAIKKKKDKKCCGNSMNKLRKKFPRLDKSSVTKHRLPKA